MRRLNLALLNSFDKAFPDFEFQFLFCSNKRKHRHVALEVVSPTRVCFFRCCIIGVERGTSSSPLDMEIVDNHDIIVRMLRRRMFEEIFVRREVRMSDEWRSWSIACIVGGVSSCSLFVRD